MPDLYIIAGCNGAGKTTAAYDLLPEVFNTVEFINADEIARGLSPFNASGASIQAGRIMLARIDQMIEKSESFSFETTLSGLTYLKLIKKAKAKGYVVTLFFVYLNSVNLATQRVKIRVSKGGHAIPENVIERRYFKGLKNFSLYAAEADSWYIYDNSATEYKLAGKNIDKKQEIINFEIFRAITKNE